MRSFFDWFEEEKLDASRPWLILGKGPTFSKRNQYDLNRYYTFSLNHVLREQPVKVAHIIDYDVVDACGEMIPRNAEFLVLPWIPHVNNLPGERNLAELVHINPTLSRMNEHGRLLWYNLSTGRRRHEDSPVVQARFFSAEAALNLLAQAGVRKVRSLGIDGGATYSQEFEDLKGKTLLANTRQSFDIQFEEIAKTIFRTGIDYAPLDIQSPIRVYVGCADAQMLAVKVLEYSIRKHASMSVEVFPLCLSGIEIPMPKDPENRPRTPFSFQRFLVPALAGYKGRAIYLDSDMQVFKDLRVLWTLPFHGADLLTTGENHDGGRRPQFSVMLLNCESLRWDIKEIVKALDQGSLTYEQLMYEMSIARNIQAEVDPAWNSLERFEEGETALLHYTDMPTQPWVSRENPLGHLWVQELFEAVDVGFTSPGFIKEQVTKGYVRPSLVYQLAKGRKNSLRLRAKAGRLDSCFVPPYQGNHKRGSFFWLRPAEISRQVLLRYYEKKALRRLSKKRRECLKSL